MNRLQRTLASLFAASAAAAAPTLVHATNGMNLEGYGPIALGMGGASMAYDNGTAGMMNNPATLGLMPEGEDRFNIAIGFLGPNVDADSPFGQTASSDADAFWMPAIGYTRKRDGWTYGIGMFAQGGMGTEYSRGTFLSSPSAFIPFNPLTATVNPGGSAVGENLENRSEVGVGRLMLPIAFDATPQLTLGGSLDFVWATMDIRMAMDGTTMADMMPSTVNPAATQTVGTIGGSMVAAMAPMLRLGMMTGLNYGYVDFSNGSDMFGEAVGYGYAGKLGMVYKVSDRTSIGVTYHTKTALDDLDTNNANLTMNVGLSAAGAAAMGLPRVAGNYDVPLSGSVKVHDFEWPATLALGVSHQANDRFMVAADLKWINWSDVMDTFSLTFTADGSPTNGSFANQTMDMTMWQNWDDQVVLSFGGAYQLNDKWTIRGGANISQNPIPDANLNYLFPAIIEDHVTGGFSYQVSDAGRLDFGASYGFNTSQASGASGITSTHSQLSWQLMYCHHF